MMQFVVAVCKLHQQQECVSSHQLLGIMFKMYLEC